MLYLILRFTMGFRAFTTCDSRACLTHDSTQLSVLPHLNNRLLFLGSQVLLMDFFRRLGGVFAMVYTLEVPPPSLYHWPAS